MRNPKWHRDEIILALDLYFDKERGSIDASNPRIIELSEILNKLPIFEVKPNREKFRNPNGVGLKLSNFLALDPEYAGKGMERGSKLDKEIFDEFYNNKEKLRNLALEIKSIISDEELIEQINNIEEDEVSENDSVQEGKVIYKLHKVRERDRKIIESKKKKGIKR